MTLAPGEETIVLSRLRDILAARSHRPG
jgi:hypothetical protein